MFEIIIKRDFSILLIVVMLSACSAPKVVIPDKTTDQDIKQSTVIRRPEIPLNSFAYVHASVGLNMRSEPKKNSSREITLVKDTNVYIIQRGVKDTIDGYEDYWYKIRFGCVEGWIFGAYVTYPVLEHKKATHMYISGHGDHSFVYLSLYRNGRFDMYVEIMEKGDIFITHGAWSNERDYITIAFDEKQTSCPKCKPYAFFKDTKGDMWDQHITQISANVYKFGQSDKILMIYGEACFKLNMSAPEPCSWYHH